MSFLSAAPILDQLHLNIQTTDGSGNVVTGTFNFQFNISTDASCTSVVFSNSTSLTTDSRGIVSYYLENTNLDYQNQYYLCYYRDSVLIETSKISRTPYSFTALNTTVSGLIVDSNLNLGGYNVTASWFNGLFNWTTSDLYNNFNGYSLTFNESRLNQTIQSFDYVTSTSGNSTYVPYTGATTNVNLGGNNLTATYLFGDGSYLTNINRTAVNYWTQTGNDIYYNLGNVGVGTTAPVYRLDVAGNVNAYRLLVNGSDVALNASLSNYYLASNPSGFYNLTTLQNVSQLNNDNSYYNSTTFPSRVSGSGTSWYIPMWNGTTSLNNSAIYQSGTNVGIGTTAPGVALEVEGIISSSSDVLAGGSVQATTYLRTPYVTPFTSGGNFDIRNYAGDTSYLSVNTTSGNVGVGTTAPAYRLDVAGNVNAYRLLVNGSDVALNASLSNYYLASNPSGFYNSTTLTTNSQLLNGNNYWNDTFATFNKTYGDTIYYGINNPASFYNSTTLPPSVSGSGDAGYVPVWNGTTSINNSVIYQNGANVGIGTTGAVVPLHIATDTNGNTIWLQGRSDNISQILFASYTNSNIGKIKVGSGYMAFFEGASEDMRIDNGNVGIGTTTPQNKLNVIGDGNFTGTVYSNGQVLGPGNITGSGTANYLSKFTAAGNVANSNVYDDGTNVGIGTTTPTAKLNVVGSFNVTDTGVQVYTEGGALVVSG